MVINWRSHQNSHEFIIRYLGLGYRSIQTKVDKITIPNILNYKGNH